MDTSAGCTDFELSFSSSIVVRSIPLMLMIRSHLQMSLWLLLNAFGADGRSITSGPSLPSLPEILLPQPITFVSKVFSDWTQQFRANKLSEFFLSALTRRHGKISEKNFNYEIISSHFSLISSPIFSYLPSIFISSDRKFENLICLEFTSTTKCPICYLKSYHTSNYCWNCFRNLKESCCLHRCIFRLPVMFPRHLRIEYSFFPMILNLYEVLFTDVRVLTRYFCQIDCNLKRSFPFGFSWRAYVIYGDFG